MKHYCACGCGKELKKPTYPSRQIKYLNEHRNRRPITLNKKFYEYLLGVTQGDGYINVSQGRVVIASSGSYTQILKKIIKESIGVTPRQYKQKNTDRIYIISRAFVELIKFYKKSGVWSVPKLEYPEYWMAGCWDTDGTITKRGDAVIQQNTQENIKLLCEYLNDLKIGYYLTKRTKQTKINGYTYNSTSYLIHIAERDSLLKFYSIIPLQHPSKIARVRKMKSIVENRRKCRLKGWWISPIMELFKNKKILTAGEIRTGLNIRDMGFILNTNWAKNNMKKIKYNQYNLTLPEGGEIG